MSLDIWLREDILHALQAADQASATALEGDGAVDTKRLAKRRVAQALNSLDAAMQCVGALWNMLQPYDEVLADDLLLIGTDIDDAIEGLKDFWHKCWGELPHDVDIYRR